MFPTITEQGSEIGSAYSEARMIALVRRMRNGEVLTVQDFKIARLRNRSIQARRQKLGSTTSNVGGIATRRTTN